ncbi:MAG: hypothetical protein L3K08_09040, partial [Thermoplasmata archaeon]|nr:hypothetical protein [Thermoplasmata archaeon]
LHAPAAEQVEVASTLERLYLARPGVGLTFSAGPREIARFPPTGELRDAAAHVFGTEFLDQSAVVGPLTTGGVTITGVVARPAISRSTSQGIFLSVNGRTVQSRQLTQAIRQAYAEYLPRTRFPVGAVQLTLDVSRVDVNVHPTKREVRISREREVADLLRRAVRAAVQSTPQVADRPDTRPPVVTIAAAPTSVGAEVGPSATPEPSPLYLPLAAIPAARQTLLSPLDERRRVTPDARSRGFELLGSLFHLYWLAEGEGELLLIDQHAASERVVYAALRESGGLARQELVSPVRVDLTARQATVLHAHAADIVAAGYDVEPFGGGAHRVLAVPVYRGRLARAEGFTRLLDELGDGGRPTVPDGLAERVAASIACHAAVRAGDEISSEEMGRILEDLHRLPEASYACPHGRPIIVRFGRAQLDRWFLRSGP